jgi:glycosyltransferase involved in cell wall biosynthesis
MKILVFSPYYPPHIGGLENHADEFNKYLSQRGVDIVVFTPRLPKNAAELETRYNKVRIVRFPAFEIIPNYPLPRFWNLKFWRLFLNLKKEKYNIVISRTRFFSTSLLALIYAKIKKIRWIHIEHGSDFPQFKGIKSKIAKAYDHTFGKLVLKSAESVVANSQASADFVKKLSGVNPEVIYRGVEIEKIEAIQASEETRKKYAGKVIIIYLGRLIEGKGVADLIQACSQIDKNYILLIIGNGQERINLENLAVKLKIKDKVSFLGQKNFNEAISLLKSADILVNPSYTEGLPTSVIEAAICRKAIVATNVGGTSEIICGKNDGFLTEAKDIKILNKKLEILIADADMRNNFACSACNKVINKFNWDTNILKYLEIISKRMD